MSLSNNAKNEMELRVALYGSAFKSGGGPLLVDIWREIITLADNGVFATKSKAVVYDSLTLEFLRDLRQVEASVWREMCKGLGATAYGAIGLSWCQEANLSDIWEDFLYSRFPLKPLPGFERPARFLNTALLPKLTKVEDINQWAIDQGYEDKETYQLAVCACIAALKEPLEFGLPPEKYAGAAPQIAAFLKSRMLRKENRSAEENAVIEVWSNTIKGTEWDVWTKEAV